MGAIKDLQIKAHELAKKAAREIESDIESLDVYYDADEYESPECTNCATVNEATMGELDSAPCVQCGTPVFLPSTQQRLEVLGTLEVCLCQLADKVLGMALQAGLDAMPPHYGDWGYEHEKYNREFWAYEAEQNDTQLGYHEWVQHKIEGEDNEC